MAGMRYYYKDPLAAAWMAKRFGMHFVESFRSDDRYNAATGEMVTTSSSCTQMHIHPDSLHLLQPRHGDLVHFVIEDHEWCHDCDGFGLIYNDQWSVEYYMADALDDIRPFVIRIVERNGAPFMWPEWEAA